MKKKLFVISAVLLLLAMPLAVVTAAGAKDSGEVVVAGVVFQEDQFMKLLTLGYQDAAKAAGVRVLLGNTGNDQAKEAELINTYVAQKVSGLVIAPLNSATSIPVLEKASSSIKIATTNSNLDNAPFIVGGYTSDNVNLGATSGEAAGKFIRDKLGGKAKIAILQFKSQLPDQSADRVNGFIDAVKKITPDVEIVADQDAWLQDRAVQVAGDILTAHNDVNIIYGANDGGTIGAVMAVKNAGLAGKCFVFGIDTGDQQLAMLRDSDNILQAVTGQDPYQMGYNAMKVLIDAVQGKDFSATKGKTIIVPGLLVSRGDPAGIDAFEKNLKEKINR
jgi:simple sugar transport system substrate-binding protein/ribose transport system substrate-binding protein